MSGMYTQTPAPGASGKFTNSEKLPLGLGTGTEKSQTCGVPVQGITISESSQLSSVSQLGCSHPVSPLRSQIALAQSRDCANVLRNLKIECAISRLVCNFRILRMRSAILRLRKFLNCAEHIHLPACLIKDLCACEYIHNMCVYMLRTDCQPDRFINGPPVYKLVSRFVIWLACF